MLRRDLFLALFWLPAIASHAQLTLLDPTFGDNGTLLVGLSGSGGDNAEAVIVQPDGRILVAGKRGGVEEDMAVLRLLENGTLDPSFSGNGVATVNIGVNAESHAITLQPDGSIIIAGSAEFPGGPFDEIALARFTSDGELDPTFSGDGVFTHSEPGASDALFALAVQPDGRILAAGKFDGTVSDMMALRLTTTGEPDETFATGGIYSSDLQTGEEAEDMVLRSDGNIVLGGAWRLDYPDADMALVQLTTNDMLDPDFGVAGLFRPSEEFSTSVAVSLAETGDGRILVAGKRYQPGGGVEEIFTGRLLPEGIWDPAYGTGGRSFLSLGSGYHGAVRDMVVLPNGKVLLTVDALDEDNTASLFALRVLEDGGLDPSFGTDGRVFMPCPGTTCNVRSLGLDPMGRVVAVGSYGSADGPEVMVMRWLAEASPVGLQGTSGRTFDVYPVPATDGFRIGVQASWVLGARLELLDVWGRSVAVLEYPGSAGGYIALPGTLANGRYLLRLVSPDRVLSAPVVVQR